MQQLMAININGEIGDVIDAFDSIWVSDTLNQKIYRIDRNAFQITNVIPTDNLIIRSLSYNDEYIWVGVQENDALPDINSSPFGGILQIDPDTNEIVNYIDMQAPIVEFAFSDNVIWTLAETNEYYTIKNINLETRQIGEGRPIRHLGRPYPYFRKQPGRLGLESKYAGYYYASGPECGYPAFNH